MDEMAGGEMLKITAAASGKKVTIFFTFWGLNVIKREQNSVVNTWSAPRMPA